MKSYCLLILAVLLSSFTNPDNTDYKLVFGSEYVRAVKWLQQHDAAFVKCAGLYQIPVKELKSIIFPELIRYNTVYDAIEINSLRYLYVNEGKDYADFSVGYFQMKPSFAEMVECDANTFLDAGFLKKSGFDSLRNTADNEGKRRERLQRITDTEQQLTYLSAFYKICAAKFSEKNFASANDKVRFYATCYNSGYRRSYENILLLQTKNYYYTGKFIKSSKYNYADISNYYFNKE